MQLVSPSLKQRFDFSWQVDKCRWDFLWIIIKFKYLWIPVERICRLRITSSYVLHQSAMPLYLMLYLLPNAVALYFPVADLRPANWRICWRTCRVVASSRCSGASHQADDQAPLHPHRPLRRPVHPWTNRPSSATSFRWQTAAAAPPTSTEPSLLLALEVQLPVCGPQDVKNLTDTFYLPRENINTFILSL